MSEQSKYSVLNDSERVIRVLEEIGVTDVSPQIVQRILMAYRTYSETTNEITIEDTARSIGACLKLKK